MSASKGGIALRYREHALRLAKRAIEALEAEGLTQGQIGKLWGGLGQGTISELKSGTVSKLGLRALVGMRQGMRMSIDDLLGLPPFAEDEAEPPGSVPAPVAHRRAR